MNHESKHARHRIATVLVLALIGLMTVAVGGSSAQEDADIPPISAPIDTAFVARAFDFADSLSGSVLAALTNSPIVLVPGGNNNSLPDSVADKLRDLEPTEIVILGGTVAVSVQVEAALGDVQREWQGSANVRRISGATRIETAQAIADEIPSMIPQAANADTVGGLGPDDLVRSDHYHTYVHRLDGDGTEVVIAENGPIQMLARCTVDDGGTDRIEIIATASVDGWFEEDDGPFDADEEAVVMENTSGTDDTEYEDDIDETSVIAEEDGTIYYVGMDGETTGLGLNLFGHDCVVSGAVFKQAG